MTNPKIVVKQNTKGEWHFALIAKNGKSVLIGGETFKRKPTRIFMLKLVKLFHDAVQLDKVEYIPKKKSR